jgi:hypothetical protein
MKYFNDLRPARRTARSLMIVEIIGHAIVIVPVCLLVSWILVQVAK